MNGNWVERKNENKPRIQQQKQARIQKKKTNENEILPAKGAALKITLNINEKHVF